ncbi:hypothetical protein [Tsukamurella ocularis]|uniref:hypothetical protein n=1 Tax=Tsukamurella ocularis TaxID=1970234 RepID=UPI002168E2CD|nr:hypothetical protein [Tsukamurella ocularis]MCS3782463.1 hypothetical protein [Tsukamurella ocularis]MCS3789985.1 hypothetical protein [Tsukamurella ocularis]MCS3853253.1 hypothetical protein [Tsukamurella ocularis]
MNRIRTTLTLTTAGLLTASLIGAGAASAEPIRGAETTLCQTAANGTGLAVGKGVRPDGSRTDDTLNFAAYRMAVPSSGYPVLEAQVQWRNLDTGKSGTTNGSIQVANNRVSTVWIPNVPTGKGKLHLFMTSTVKTPGKADMPGGCIAEYVL